MRLFVGLEIDEEIVGRITAFVEQLKRVAPDVRFVGPETYHVTLQFLGETGQFERIDEALKTVQAPSFELSIGGTGFFPNARKPRIFWTGIQCGPQLQVLAEGVTRALTPVGFERDNPFSPHLTLARSGSGSPRPKSGDRVNLKFQQLLTALDRMQQPEFGTMTAREFILYESKLSPRGAQYYARARYPLI